MMRRWGPLVAVVAASALASLVLARMTAERSLLDPGAGLDPGLAAVTLVALLLRSFAMFVVPFVVAYRLFPKR